MSKHQASKGIRSSLIGVAVNIVLAVFKGTAGYVGHSYALIADAIESLSDVVSSLIVAGGLKIASLPRDENHPYGHGKAEPIAATLVGFALVAAATTIAIQSIHEIRTPHYVPAPFTLLVLIAVIVTKEMLFRFVFKVGDSVASTAVKTDAWHHRSDAITSLAVFIGISIALIGGKGYESADDWAALVASVIIVFNAYRLLRPAVEEVMDTAPSTDIITSVRGVATTVPEVMGVEKCFVRKMGFDYFVDIHIWVDGDISVSNGHEVASQVRQAIQDSDKRITDILVHVEPDEQIMQRLQD
ncbi:MAG: cation diffusion facilitator family transporter [Armatimonadetes bacterium]|nr:cation diffusion facilitator family transporter [Armatimonadota bacterium]